MLLFASEWEVQYFERQNPTFGLLAESPSRSAATDRTKPDDTARLTNSNESSVRLRMSG